MEGKKFMDLNTLIKSRRTIRKFRQERLSVSLLENFIDAARVAPSGSNIQPLKYIVVQSEEMTQKLFPLVRWAGYLAPNYNPSEEERPTAYIAVCADLSLRKEGYEPDMGAAVENLILSAFSNGVGACWMKAIDYEKISELLNLEKNLKLLCIVALGYPDESPQETEMKESDVKYYIGEDGELHVPKRTLAEVLVKMV